MSHGVARCSTFPICYTVNGVAPRCSTVSHSMPCYTFKSSHTNEFDGVADIVLHRGFCGFCKPSGVRGLRKSDGVAKSLSPTEIYTPLSCERLIFRFTEGYASTVSQLGCGL